MEEGSKKSKLAIRKVMGKNEKPVGNYHSKF